MNFIKRHFPSTKTKWKLYLAAVIPMILGSTLFALNSVVDNFMVGSIEQGQTALGAINSWTGIYMGWLMGVAAGGSVIFGQFWSAERYKIVREVSRYRTYLSFIPGLLLAIVAWTTPDTLTKTFYHGDNQLVFDHARDYAKIIAFQWMLIAVSFNLGNQLREIGYAFHTMIWGIGTLAANITLNATLMYGFGMGVEGAAWASVSGRVVAITYGVILIMVKKIQLGWKPWTVFKVSWEVRVLFWKRWIYILSVFTVVFFITYRTSLYDLGYDEGDGTHGLGMGVTGLSVVALTGALMNVFTTTFGALASMSARFVASELGKGNLEQAKINSDELKGFATFISFVLSVILVIFATCVPFMGFLSEDKYENGVLSFDGKANLDQVRNALYVIAFFYPWWIWFTVSYRNGNSGGKDIWFSIIDWVTAGLQLVWLWLIVAQIIPGWEYAENNFWVTYSLFFISDWVKMGLQEWRYYQYKWLHSLTKEEKDEATHNNEADTDYQAEITRKE